MIKFGRAATLGGALYVYFGFYTSLLSSIIGLFTGSLFGKYRYQYLDYAANQKCTLTKNRPASQATSEQDAFKAGLDAKNWQGYYTSYLNFATYKHPLAFAAGLRMSLDTLQGRAAGFRKMGILKKVS